MEEADVNQIIPEVNLNGGGEKERRVGNPREHHSHSVQGEDGEMETSG